MSQSSYGYREVEHTADWELEVWAPDLCSLLEQAARGMYALAGVRLEESGRIQRWLELSAEDAESLLVTFLTELLYLGERDGLAFDEFQITLQGCTLLAQLAGARLIKMDREIKAVTYHNLQVIQTAPGVRVNIVFDV